MSYVGRFAPSPTGEIHLGTLAAAIASFLHARQANGDWLVRIEDIDPPREVPGSADAILRTLAALELRPDGEILYQSTRTAAYQAAARQLLAADLAYYCRCSRRDLRRKSAAGRYPGTCRHLNLPPTDAALRLRTNGCLVEFDDRLHGHVRTDFDARTGDFIVFRRDGLPAYHLAVVVDDAAQGVTDIVRGADLLPSTAPHILLQRALGLPTPDYWHIPLVRDEQGRKLSKSSTAEPVDARNPARAAVAALAHLGLDVPDTVRASPISALWQWAIEAFRIERLAAPEAGPQS